VPNQQEICAFARVKSLRRVADKAAHLLASRLSHAIRAAAANIAEERAWRAGLSLEQLISSADTMTADFAAAEQVVASQFLDASFPLNPHELRIDDLYAATIVAPRQQFDRAFDAITSAPHILDARPLPHSKRSLRIELDCSHLRQDTAHHSTADSIFFELSVLTPDELIELELGAYLPEQRLLDAHKNLPYHGPLAKNASYLIHFLLMLAVSPCTQLDELPLNMWGRYLPETIADATWRLFGIQLPSALIGTPNQEE
jgi:hypothetical protein